MALAIIAAGSVSVIVSFLVGYAAGKQPPR